VAATGDGTVSYAPERGRTVGRDLALYGVAATFVVAAAIGAVRYGVLLIHLHRLDDIDQYLESGWQVTFGKVAVGCLIVAVGVLAGYFALRLGRSVADRSPHTRAMRFASVLPGLLLGLGVIHPIHATLIWASSHTSRAAADRAAGERFLAEMRKSEVAERKAPLRFHTTQPAAPPSAAQRLVHPASLGAGWFNIQDPGSTLVSVRTTLRNQGAKSGILTRLTQATRTATGWQLNIIVDERSIAFRTPSEAARYATRYRTETAKACDCGLTLSPVTVTHATTTVIDGVVVHSWLLTSASGSSPEASFNVGRNAYAIAMSDLQGKASKATEASALLRTAVTTAKTGHRT
jgi:hypothetical protein